MATIPDLDEAAYYRVKQIEGHNCKLVHEEDSICQHIKSGYFVPLRRAIRKSMIISPHDPRAKFLAKSTCRMRREQNRHLERHYYMIHPFSEFYYYWLTILTITHLFLLLMTPIYGMHSHEMFGESIVQQLTMIYFSAIIIVSFFVGYYDKETDQVILKRSKVIKKYLCTHFIFDLLSTCMYTVVTGNYHTIRAVWICRAQMIFRLSRLFTINEYLKVLQVRKNIPKYICKTLKILMFGLLCILWLTFYYFSTIVHTLPANVLKHELISMTLAHVLRKYFLLDIFAGPYAKITSMNLYMSIVGLHVGKLFEIWLLAQIVQIFSSYTKVNHRYKDFFYQIKTYIRIKDLPNRLSRRILKYLNFRFQYFVFKERDFVENLSSTLKNDILWHTCQSLVIKVETFKELPPHVMIKMASMMKPEIYLPNDVVVNAGEVGNEMFFTRVGVLAVFTESGKEICHLAEGSHFGEIALLLNEKRVASVVAIDFCQLYRLTKRDFQEVIDPYPSIKADIMKLAKDRFMELRLLTGK